MGRKSPGLAERIDLPAGSWRLEVDSTGPIRASVRSSRDGLTLAEGPAPLDVEVRAPEGLRVDVVLAAAPMTQARVREARFVR